MDEKENYSAVDFFSKVDFFHATSKYKFFFKPTFSRFPESIKLCIIILKGLKYELLACQLYIMILFTIV